MPILDTGAVRLHYEMEGKPSRAVLLLSNSLGTNLAMWDPQLPAFREHVRVLRYDSRGHGRSSVPDGPYSIAQMGQDVLALLDALGIERVHFCGLSLGGMVGQWLAVNAPYRLHNLLLSNTAAKIGSAEGWNERIAQVERGGMQSVAAAVVDRWFTPAFQSMQPQTVERIAAMLLATSAAGYTAACAAVRDMDQRETVSHIDLPTLILYGAEDAVTPPHNAVELATAIRGAELLPLPAAHLANLEAAAAFTQAALAFFTRKESVR